MPSECELATYYNVSAPTIREAIWVLQLYLQQRAASHPENRVSHHTLAPNNLQNPAGPVAAKVRDKLPL